MKPAQIDALKAALAAAKYAPVAWFSSCEHERQWQNVWCHTCANAADECGDDDEVCELIREGIEKGIYFEDQAVRAGLRQSSSEALGIACLCWEVADRYYVDPRQMSLMEPEDFRDRYQEDLDKARRDEHYARLDDEEREKMKREGW